MYRVLVVDDEPIIVEGLYELLVNSKNYELDVYKAYSGIEAFNILSTKRMDVVLSDIKMPGMNGLQLLEYIRDNWPYCKVVFLTGYSEFDYVYKAIQHDGVGYLLKTESYESILDTIEKYLADIEKNSKLEEQIIRSKEQTEKLITLLQKEFLTEVFDSESRNYGQQQLDELQIPLRLDAPVILLLGCVNDLPESMHLSEKLKVFYSVKDVAQKYLPPYAASTYTVYRSSYMIWLAQPVNPEGIPVNCDRPDGSWDKLAVAVKGALESVQAACSNLLGASLSFVVNQEPVPWSGIPEKILEMKSILNHRKESYMEVLLINNDFYSSESGGQLKKESAVQKAQMQLHKLDSFRAYLEQGRKDEFLTALKNLRDILKEESIMNESLIYEAYYTIYLFFLSHINRYNLNMNMQLKIGMERLLHDDKPISLDAMFDFFENLAVSIFEMQNSEYEKRSVNAIAYIEKYIADNLNEDITLARLAEKVYFNPKYLSRLFKQIKGVHLSDYINELKISRAKELLKKSNLRINEIASSVGFFSAPYFTRFFKKATNLTPQEYRDAYIYKKAVGMMK